MSRLHNNLYLFWCAHEHIDFRIPEFESIAKILNIPLKVIETGVLEIDDKNGDLYSRLSISDSKTKYKTSCLATNCQNGKNQEVPPWLILELNSENEAREILSRSISTKYCIHLWSSSQCRSNLHEKNKAFIRQNIENLEKNYFDINHTFKINIDAFMKKFHNKEKHERIESFSYIPFKGEVSLKNPHVTLVALEFYGFDHNNLPEEPFNFFFGRLIGEGQRDLISQFSLKKRCFIGNTSMDPQLSFLMTNLACVTNGSLMLDPFCGTGSLMLTAARFGAHVIGTDIDYLTLHARTKPSRVNCGKKRASDESLKRNFLQVGGKELESKFLGVFVADASNPPFRENLGVLFDSIITDPPYGIREPAEKVGIKRREVPDHYKIPEEHLPLHFPQKTDYDLGTIYTDLVEFASKHLVEGGRLVYWIPVNREHYAKNQEDSLPKHINLKLISNCEQILNSHTSRRCITMEKVINDDKGFQIKDVEKAHLSCDITVASSDTVKQTTENFRNNFFKPQEITRQERKARIKEFGHLNLENN